LVETIKAERIMQEANDASSCAVGAYLFVAGVLPRTATRFGKVLSLEQDFSRNQDKVGSKDPADAPRTQPDDDEG
jgi:hypothetical protein